MASCHAARLFADLCSLPGSREEVVEAGLLPALLDRAKLLVSLPALHCLQCSLVPAWYPVDHLQHSDCTLRGSELVMVTEVGRLTR